MKHSIVTLLVPVIVSLAGAGFTVAAHAQTAPDAPKSRETVKSETKAARKAGTIVEGDKAGVPSQAASAATMKKAAPAKP